ncbi:hypothetical protein CASFOL_025090 [Castilleja foliolosa]|uniref:Uncharacterized protein n=1 Tax=Castilleja foliolosa TaxID=1961234 RepID=A0ABD3CQ51_9LAMI
MAIRFSLCSSLTLPPNNHDPNKGSNRSRFLMCAKNGISDNHQIKLSDQHKIKVFEDRSTGIVCYKDENGEIICEGYDEGPRFHHQISRCSSNSSRDMEIIDLLQRCWIHVVDENEFKIAENNV